MFYAHPSLRVAFTAAQSCSRLLQRVTLPTCIGCLNPSPSPHLQRGTTRPEAFFSTGTKMEQPSSSNKFDLSKKYKGLEKNVWVEFIQLALEYKPVNLGQGFPDYPVPEYVTKGLAQVATDGSNILYHQYTRGFGHPRLVNVLSKFYGKLIGRELNSQKEILVSGGAYEALFCAIMGNVDQGDEVVIIEPFFDCYEPMVRLAGGTPVFVPLRPSKTEGTISSGEWRLDSEELASSFNNKTKMIIVNTPHNPLGKVFTRDELLQIADLCKKWNVICLMDEVYEWLVYEGHEHIRMASLPGMWERTLTVGSAGKTFSVTGWKLGWAYGPQHLMQNLQVAHQHCLYTCATPTQEAVARYFEMELQRFGSPECYFTALPKELQGKRDYMAKVLKEVGMCPTIPEGGYFMVADWSSLADKTDLSGESDAQKDYRFAKWMAKTHKLQGIPPSAFYSDSHKSLGENFIRYCFFKDDTVLEKAQEIFQSWKKSF